MSGQPAVLQQVWSVSETHRKGRDAAVTAVRIATSRLSGDTRQRCLRFLSDEKNGFSLFSIENDEYIFVLTDELKQFLNQKGGGVSGKTSSF